MKTKIFLLAAVLTWILKLSSWNCTAQWKVIEGGAYFSVAVCTTGTAQSWGNDAYGQLGDDAPLVQQNNPVQVSGLTGMEAIAAGNYYSLARKGDGTVWSWGADDRGQLGDDAVLADKATPVQVSGLTNVKVIAAGGYHSLAVKNDGTVWSWGSDDSGQLGDDAVLAEKSTPVQVSGLTGITAVAAGGGHSLAVKNDGTVWAWGDDAYGKLGDDAVIANKATPVQVSGLTGITAVSAGLHHSLALKNDGTIWSWGLDSEGQLGDDATIADKSTPVQVSGLTGAIAIAAGSSYFSLALKNDSTVWSWGSDNYGQLGDNASYVDQPTPVQVSGLTGIAAIAIGAFHSLASKNDGRVFSWGRNWPYGQLGIGTAALGTEKPTPVEVIGECYVYPLPVEWLYFNAIYEKQTNAVRCEWATASEFNSDYFEVQRAINLQGFQNLEGLEWNVVGIVKGAGNSSTTKRYSFIDTDPPFGGPGGLLFYRLRQVDYDGQFEYSYVRAVYMDALNSISIYPNPAGDYIHYTISGKSGGTAIIEIFDILGREVVKKEETLNEEVVTGKISTANLSGGAYLFKVINGNIEKTQKLFIVK